MPSNVKFEAQFSPRGSAPATRRRPDAPMCILLLGDFSGRDASERAALAQRPTLRVDLDNLDDVMLRLAPRAEIQLGGAAVTLDIEQLDDFHPDALFDKLPLFRALREMRARLLDPARFEQAAAELRQASPPAASALAPAAPTPSVEADTGDLLGNLLGGTPAGRKAAAAPAASGIDALIRSIVAPHIVPDSAPLQATYLASVDSAIGEQMRALLHAPGFQSLESAWRGVQWLIANLELDESLQLHLFDVSRDELQADLVAAQGHVEQTGLHRALVDRWRNQPGADGWSFFAGLYSFGPADADIGVLAALGLLGSMAGAPVLAAATPALVGAASFAAPVQQGSEPAAWQALRRSEAAPWIGLAAPRVLLRGPYGKTQEPTERFTFEEFGNAPAHEALLWGNGALAAALLIGRAFMARGWQFEPGDEREIGDLPACAFDRDGERELQACAEFYLGETNGQAMLEAGLMPLLSHRHANAVTVMRMQSVAAPAQALAGLARA